MRFSFRPWFALLSCLLLACPVGALVEIGHEEEFGPAPEKGKVPDDKRKALAYLPGRVYCLHQFQHGFGHSQDDWLLAFQGDVEGVNAALRAFAAIPGDKEIRLFPGPGLVRSVGDKVSQGCDWQINRSTHMTLPRGEIKKASETHTAVMTVFVARARPILPPDPRCAEWIKDLDDPQFPLRQRSFARLAEQGDSALPLFQEALASSQTLEKRIRLEQLIGRLKSIHVARLKILHGIPVVSLDALLQQEKMNWASGDLAKSWYAAQKVSAWADYTEESFSILIDMLDDKREQVRELAEKAFQRLGPRVAQALPALQTAWNKAESTGKTLGKEWISVTRHASLHSSPQADESWRRNRELRVEIEAYCKNHYPKKD